MTWETVARPHIGHRASLRELFKLRCHDCDVTLVLPTPALGTRTPPRRNEWCPRHPGEWPDSCRGCASEQKAGDQ